jgi:hypothetical protein
VLAEVTTSGSFSSVHRIGETEVENRLRFSPRSAHSLVFVNLLLFGVLGESSETLWPTNDAPFGLTGTLTRRSHSPAPSGTIRHRMWAAPHKRALSLGDELSLTSTWTLRRSLRVKFLSLSHGVSESPRVPQDRNRSCDSQATRRSAATNSYPRKRVRPVCVTSQG